MTLAAAWSTAAARKPSSRNSPVIEEKQQAAGTGGGYVAIGIALQIAGASRVAAVNLDATHNLIGTFS